MKEIQIFGDLQIITEKDPITGFVTGYFCQLQKAKNNNYLVWTPVSKIANDLLNKGGLCDKDVNKNNER